jgi:lipoprotein-releasing system ATP-binding protein
MSFLQVENLSKNYGQQKVLQNLSLKLERSEQMVIQGMSGCGKSTFLYLLGGLERYETGKIQVSHQELSSMGDDQLAKYRNGTVGFVFQFHFLLPSLDCLGNILLPARIGGKFSPMVQKRVLEMAKYLDVATLLHKFPHEISGGEQQRVNIIRALSLRPELLLCDEPTGNLDSINSQKVISLIRQLAREFEATLILVTHDRDIAAQFENVRQMRDGHFIP